MISFEGNQLFTSLCLAFMAVIVIGCGIEIIRTILLWHGEPRPLPTAQVVRQGLVTGIAFTAITAIFGIRVALLNCNP